MGHLFGAYFRILREKAGMSLRGFCAEYGFDAGNISKLERGTFPPPDSMDKLKAYAQALQLRSGSTEWIEFFDRAAASRGKFPQDLQQEEDLVKHLPLLFRTLRGQKLSAESLDKVVEVVREANAHVR